MLNVRNVTLRALRELYASASDDKFHVLWVDTGGGIHLDVDDNESDFNARIATRVKFRWEAFAPGNGYVGPRAAKDLKYMRKQLQMLKADWTSGATGYVDF